VPSGRRDRRTVAAFTRDVDDAVADPPARHRVVLSSTVGHHGDDYHGRPYGVHPTHTVQRRAAGRRWGCGVATQTVTGAGDRGDQE